jgi:hypothetical protein
MKTNERMTSSVLEALLHTAFEANREHIKINAQAFALKNMPKIVGDRMGAYFEEDHQRYQHPVDEVNKELQFKATCQQVADHARATEEQQRNLDNKYSAAKEKQIAIDAKFKKTPYPKGQTRQTLAWVAIGIIALFEGILSMPVYERWGYNFIESVLMGLLFAGVLAILAHTFLKIVFLGRTLWQQRVIAFSLLFFLTLLFKYMADVRADYLSGVVNANTTDALNQHFSPWPFVCISLLLFIAAVAVNYFVMPTKKERGDLLDYEKALQAKQDIEAKIAQIEADKAKVHQEHNALKASSASILEYGSMLEESIMTHARSGYALWKKHNMMHRTDNTKPDCFDQPYPFSFITNFHTIKQMNHEINN